MTDTSSNESHRQEMELREKYVHDVRQLFSQMGENGSDTTTHQASINTHGGISHYGIREPWAALVPHEVHAHAQPSGAEELALPLDADPSVVVRREAASRAAAQQPVGAGPADAPGGGAPRGQKAEALLQEQESSTNVKIIVLSAVVLVALALVCVAAVCLVWKPLNAIFEERAFEQAAKNAVLSAVPPAPGAEEAGNAEEQNAGFREEKLKQAWKTFFDDPMLKVLSENLLRRVMLSFFEKEGYTNQMEDLFNGLAADGAESIKKEDMERVCESVSGTLRNMQVKGSGISTVDYHSGFECSLAVVTVEDYAWFFDNYETVFPETKPMDRKSFPGVVSLVLAWNCVRTLHTARHMNPDEIHRTISGNQSSSVSVEFKIDLRGGVFPFEGKAEINTADAAVAALAAAEDSDDDRPKKSDSWSEHEEAAP